MVGKPRSTSVEATVAFGIAEAQPAQAATNQLGIVQVVEEPAGQLDALHRLDQRFVGVPQALGLIDPAIGIRDTHWQSRPGSFLRIRAVVAIDP